MNRDLEQASGAFDPAERTPLVEIEREQQLILGSLYKVPGMLAALDTVFDLVFILDQHRQAVFANRAALEFLKQKDASKIQGLRLGDIFHCTHAQDDAGGCGVAGPCRFCGVLRAEQDVGRQGRSVERCLVMQDDGGAFEFDVGASAVRVEGEQFIVFAIRDVTSERRRELIESIFFHDVFNIAAALLTMVEVFQRVEEGRRDLMAKKVGILTRRLVEEIQAQQNLSLAERHELILNVRELRSQDVLRQAVEFYRELGAANRVRVEIDDASEDVLFRSDPALIGRILSNLLKNAIEASQGEDAVTAGCRRSGEAVEFWVHNRSCIPPEAQLQVFKRSFSTKGKSRGLGTYSIRLFVEGSLHGKVSFVSTPEAGTTFTVRLPLVLEEKEGGEAASS